MEFKVEKKEKNMAVITVTVPNDEFRKAKESILQSIRDMKLPEAEVFEREFLPAFLLPLDELG